jgi:hypothetical protein
MPGSALAIEMTEIAEKNLAEELAKVSTDMRRLVVEHLAVNDNTIPNVLFGDLAGFTKKMWRAHKLLDPFEPNSERKVQQVFDFVERCATSSDGVIVDAVTLSFLENLLLTEPYYEDYFGMLGAGSIDCWNNHVGELFRRNRKLTPRK